MNEILFRDFIKFQRGFDLPRTQMIEGEYPVVGSTTIIGNHNEYKVYPPGVVTGRSGSLGTVQYIKKKYWPHNTSLWVKDFKDNDPAYVYYFLKEFGLQRFDSGVGVPTLNRNDLNNYEIRIHEIKNQKIIASVLSAYDDLIENNTRRTKILEEMAQTIYKEWFVNFRFPGYEKVKVVDSSLGKIPKGWEWKNLNEIANIVMGQSPKSEFYNVKGIGLPFHQGVTDFGFRFPSHKTFCSVENRIAEKYDILFSVRAPVGRINIANTKMIIGRGLSAIHHKSDLQSFLFYHLKNIFSKEDTIGSGAIFNSVTKEDMHNIKIISPNNDIEKKFDELVKPLDLQIENLNSKISNLRKTRDLLIPKLMSGEVPVSD